MGVEDEQVVTLPPDEASPVNLVPPEAAELHAQLAAIHERIVTLQRQELELWGLYFQIVNNAA